MSGCAEVLALVEHDVPEREVLHFASFLPLDREDAACLAEGGAPEVIVRMATVVSEPPNHRAFELAVGGSFGASIGQARPLAFQAGATWWVLPAVGVAFTASTAPFAEPRVYELLAEAQPELDVRRVVAATGDVLGWAQLRPVRGHLWSRGGVAHDLDLRLGLGGGAVWTEAEIDPQDGNRRGLSPQWAVGLSTGLGVTEALAVRLSFDTRRWTTDLGDPGTVSTHRELLGGQAVLRF